MTERFPTLSLFLAMLLVAVPPVLCQDGEGDSEDEIDWSEFEALDDDDDEELHDGLGLGDAFADLLDQLIEDPSLGGKIRFYYAAIYRGRMHEFADAELPFPAIASADDVNWGQELEDRHRDWDDHDLDQYLSLSWREFLTPEEDSWWQRVDLDFSTRWFQDLDGSSGGEATLGTFDAFPGNGHKRLQSLNLRGELFDRHLEVRAGRQYLREAEWIHFDGAHVRFRGLTVFGREVELSAFGGARVRLFRRASSEHVGFVGAAVKIWPWEGARLRLSELVFVDSSFEAHFLQRFDLGYAAFTYRQINADPQSIWLDLHLDHAKEKLKVNLGYRGKLGSDADDFDFDFTRSRRRDASGTQYLFFGDLAPYDEVRLDAHKGLFDYWGVFAGGTIHQLRDRDQRDEWNTDWQEAWLGVDVLHAPWKGFTGRVTVRYMHTDLRRRLLRLDITPVSESFQPQDITGDGEPDFLGVDLLLEQDFFRVVAAGVVFVFRGYDYRSNYAFLENLTASSATAYVRWNPTPRIQWQMSYSHDRDFDKLYPDLEALHSVRIQFSYRF